MNNTIKIITTILLLTASASAYNEIRTVAWNDVSYEAQQERYKNGWAEKRKDPNRVYDGTHEGMYGNPDVYMGY